MSEEIAAAPVSEPSSTADVAASILESYEEPAAETPAEPAPVEAAPASPVGVVESEVDGLLREAGYTDPREPSGREHRIPHSKVRKIIENGLKKGRTEWETTRQTIERERDEHKSQVETFRSLLSDPDEKKFLAAIAEIDPRYARFLAPPPVPQQQPEADDPEPAPDYDLGNGQMTYSLEGLRKVRAWERRQMQRELDAKLKPLTEREQRFQQEAQQREHEQQLRSRTQKELAEAQTWPMFGPLAADGTLTPYQQEVLDELKRDKRITLRQAHLEVERRHQEPDKVRARLLAELKQAPKSTSVSRGPTDTPRPAGPTSTADVAARVMERLERGA
jgi:hypothetical protein